MGVHERTENFTLTDTHYDQRNRRGRHVMILASLAAENDGRVFGTAADECAAVVLAPEGQAPPIILNQSDRARP